ncbi:MAG: hypothetical protein QOG72_429 [Sphingomonadales bacterium]|nr:hypothetical protein [Sphingomonadales bacterium]
MPPPVRVRMYKRLLGDCFLITVGDPLAPRDERSHILIDCGVLQQVPGEAALMEAVADDVAARVEGRLDLLVVTHEHWDHISGFAHARGPLIDDMIIDRLWLAWTERRGDGQADAYRAKSVKAKKTVAEAAVRAGLAAAEITARLEDFMGAAGPGGGKLTSLEIIPALIARATETGDVDYLEPGEVRETPGPISLTAYVLGPPRKPSRLTQDLPSPGDAKETFIVEQFEAALDARYNAAETLGAALDAGSGSPFARGYPLEVDEIEDPKADSDQRWLQARYYGPAEKRRRIDLDWLGSAGPLALKLDSDTNNTSLVLAFELEAGGRVLLFAADAQVGNWLSWHDQDYPADEPTVTARDLLGRTVLYKVGHHASHNATLNTEGLARMTHPELVAMIPVSEAEARREKGGKAVHRGWDMPFPDLLVQLVERTNGRVLRGDSEPGKDPSGRILTEDAAFLGRVTDTGLYLEYEL